MTGPREEEGQVNRQRPRCSHSYTCRPAKRRPGRNQASFHMQPALRTRCRAPLQTPRSGSRNMCQEPGCWLRGNWECMLEYAGRKVSTMGREKARTGNITDLRKLWSDVLVISDMLCRGVPRARAEMRLDHVCPVNESQSTTMTYVAREGRLLQLSFRKYRTSLPPSDKPMMSILASSFTIFFTTSLKMYST